MSAVKSFALYVGKGRFALVTNGSTSCTIMRAKEKSKAEFTQVKCHAISSATGEKVGEVYYITRVK